MEKMDLVVIGSGPAGHFGAIQAAKAGKQVAVVESLDRVGGASALHGTVPSKSLREATMHLTGRNAQAFYGMNYRVKHDITIQDLVARTHTIIQNETEVFADQLRRNGVQLLGGHGSFVGPHQVVVECGNSVRLLKAQNVLIACGSRPARPPGMEFDGERILDSNQILTIKDLPRRQLIVGAGVIGVEYACIFAALGVHVTLINDRPGFFEFVDRHIVEVLKYHMQNHNVDFRFNEKVVDVSRRGDLVVCRTESNKEIAGDRLLYTVGRQGNTDGLNLEVAGLEADKRGRLEVDSAYRTRVPHIYAAGDVVGFPALASTSREQGRRAVCHAFDLPIGSRTTCMPYGIYSIPEISMVGPTEEELTAERVPYEIGVARYREIARGQIIGDTDGLLKLLFHRETLALLGVHIVGEGATELVHIGQAVEAMKGTIHYFANAVFNYPTLAECYKVAALDGLNRVRMSEARDSVDEVEPDPVA